MMGRSSSAPGGKISISATTQKIQVDNRIALRFYFRIADNILKQANIFREEKNIVDLYVMLLRFSSLVSETIPFHRDYRTSQQNNKLYLKKKLIAALAELEELKPDVEAKLEELQSKQMYQQNKPKSYWSNETQVSTFERPALKQQNWNGYLAKKRSDNTSRENINEKNNLLVPPVTREFVYQGFNALSAAKPVEEHLRRISLSIPRPKEETLSKHSILGPNGLSGQWQPPSNLKVQYPSNLDFTPPQIPRDNNFVQQSVKDEIITRQDDEIPEKEKTTLEPPIQPESDNQRNQDFVSLISFETEDDNSLKPEVIAQPSPPILAEVQDLILPSTCATATESGLDNVSDDASVCTEDPLQLHIPTKLMDTFMKLAKSNTNKNLETCGVLAGSLKNRKFYITALIVPKQESTSDSCQTTNEEEIFEVQDKQSLFPLGWIHTHPTQSCFMSSIDVHTHYSYQIMLPEAIAIVMAPRDSSRNHGIFRLTPGGMTVIRQCPRRGFHSHDPPSDGSPIYRQCTDVYMNSTLKFDIIDLR